MKLLLIFLRLVRWPNLVFIILTQLLFYYCVLPFVYANNISDHGYALSGELLIILVTASVLIAAAGYIINDYFDLNIDLVNKPDKLFIDKYINRRWAILWHMMLSFAGFVLSCYVGYKLRNIYIPFANLFSIIALWFYSTTFKKKLLIGNILISLLTAWVILVIAAAEYPHVTNESSNIISRLLKVSFLYAGFAFIISLVREVVKDMEDIQGDMKYNCKTMPIVWGIPVAKIFSAVWLSVLIGALVIVQFLVFHFGWWLSIAYTVILIILPLVWLLKKIYEAQLPAEYHRLSTVIKMVMFTGILSMIFFKIYS